ncbi:hypothetical protein L2E82_17051 [Cichorium intybus]|uniref:Uncharacterized protein n=1 Tax=Cichorium intybus TaxID=13427 RepID=A0ACB9F7V9_CICIN|nr:hypothetical protein L2E82_17051 [Cichorium intybus]
MLPIKSESIENPPEVKSTGIKFLPDIKSETIEFPPDVKLESIEYTQEIPPTKRLKTLSSASPSPSSKGKSKVIKEEDDDSLWEQQLDTCGVCLLEEGMSRRGFIDSCEHYFCFVCIMEWAKVESRCPICKRRFSTIRRPQDGVFLSERIVNIPVRDQVYYHNGNTTLGPSDPYSQVKCTICSLSSDDHLLLLCDLCDSAAHSYCVGLGATVPEGDWFCQDCTFSRNEHAKIDTDTNFENDTPCPSTSNSFHFTQSNVSINDIVRESRNQSCIQEPDSSSMAPSFGQTETVGIVDRNSNSTNARTLKRCVNVHARIKVLRENWDGFRGGSLNFSSSFGGGVKESQPESTSNVDKAWKMMDMAAKALGKKNPNDKNSKLSLKKERLVNDASKVRLKNNYFGGFKKHENGGASRNQNHVEREVLSSRKIVPCGHVKNCGYNGQNVTKKDCVGVTSNVVGSSDRLLIGKDKWCEKKEIDNGFKEKGGIMKETQLDSNIEKVENDKSEIRSLVKLNLKLLSRDKKLEVDVFKEVARHATHSIMASCGIEQPNPRFRSFERLICDHNQTKKRPISTLMPTCCRECFFNFVKDVVTAIAFDKTSSFRT